MTQELIAKLQNLTAPCRETDAEIYAFLHDDDGFIPFKVFRQQAWPKAPRFTESIDAGLSYVPEELSAYINLDPEKPFVRLYDSGGWLVTECIDKPPAIALNICALTVLGKKTLKQFYREMQAWIDDGCPQHEVFKTFYGLCDTLFNWGGERGRYLLSEIKDQFSSAGLCRTLPFNKGCFSDYAEESFDGTQYQNPARLQWIKEHAS